MSNKTDGFKSGFVSIIGRPNVGKSTLLNSVLGEKIAIMSDKPQTTRNRINAIYTDKEAQIIFIDTPGLHKPKNKLGEFMVKSALNTLGEVDIVLFMVDNSTKIGPGDEYILDLLKNIKTPIYLVINKMDLTTPEEYLTILDNFKEYDFIRETYCISALDGKNVQFLVDSVKKSLEEGPMFYPEDMITDQPERVISAEIIREKLLKYLDEEIPHGVAVEIESMKPRKNKDMVDIEATIICEKDSHKGIIIGKGGRKLKGVGKSAREEIELLLGSKVFLTLFVKVKPGWRNSDTSLKNYGYRES
jgi:GTPase